MQPFGAFVMQPAPPHINGFDARRTRRLDGLVIGVTDPKIIADDRTQGTERQRDFLKRPVIRIAHVEHKPIFTPHLDTGDHVIVINASKVALTGNKADQKTYFRHSGYMGHEKHIPFKRMIERFP